MMSPRSLGITLFSASLLVAGPALAQGDTHLSATLSCSQMKQRLTAVQSFGTAVHADATTGNTNPLETNSVREITEARHEAGAGDDACSRGDRDAARDHYQRAIDLLAVPH